jgi:peptidoglycan/LPS O-acetylase OafA/YrhL
MIDNKYFTNPDIYATFEPASDKMKKGFFAKIIPYNYIKYTLYSLALLFVSPIVLVLLNLDLMQDASLFYPILWTLCISFLLYAILAGAILIVYKIPYMQELKEKLGYTER